MDVQAQVPITPVDQVGSQVTPSPGTQELNQQYLNKQDFSTDLAGKPFNYYAQGDETPVIESGSDLKSFAQGAGNNLLFGANVFGKPGANATDKQNALYGRGQALGTVTNIAGTLPLGGVVGGIGKLAEALNAGKAALQGAKVLEDGSLLLADGSTVAPGIASKIGNFISGWGSTGRIMGGITRGATEGAIQSGLSNIGQSNDNAGADALVSAGIGGALGGAGAGIGKFISRAPQALEEMANNADANVSRNIFKISPKAIRNSVGGNPLTAGSTLTVGRINQAYKKIADLFRSGIAMDPQDVQNILAEQGPYWQEANNIYDKLMADNPNFLRDKIDEIKALPQTRAYLDYMGEQGRASEATKNVSDLLKRASASGSLQGLKANLDTQTAALKSARPNGDTDGYSKSLLGDMTYAIRNMVSDDALKMANAPENIKQFYADSSPIRQAILYDALSPKPTLSNNSTTWLSQAFNSILNGGGFIAGGYPGAVTTQFASQLAQKLGRKVGNETIGGLASGVRPFVNAVSPLAGALKESGVGNILQASPQYSGAIQPMLERNGIGTDTGTNNTNGYIQGQVVPNNLPEQVSNVGTPQNNILQNNTSQNTMADNKPITTDLYGNDITNPGYQNAILNGIKNQWFQETKGMYPPNVNDPNFRQFAIGMIKSISTNGMIDPQKATNLLFLNPTDRANYMNYVSSENKIASLAQSALPSTGLAGTATGFIRPVSTASKNALVDAVEQATGSKAAVNEAEKMMMLKDYKNASDLSTNLLNIIKKYNPRVALTLKGIGQ